MNNGNNTNNPNNRNNGYNRSGANGTNERQIPQNGRQNPAGDPGMGQPRPRVQNSQGRPMQNQNGRQMPPAGQGRPAPEGGARSGRPMYGEGPRPASTSKRKATKEQMRVENSRRRKESFKVFLSRLALYGVMLLVIGGIGAAVFFGFFYSTPDANKASITYFETYDGRHTDKVKVSESVAYPDGVLYLNFSSIADGCDMSVIRDSGNVKFILPDGDDHSDSSGTGKEEYVIFTKKSTECTVCGQPARLSAPAVFDDKDIWVPASFVTDYMNGITVKEEKANGKVYIERESTGAGDNAELVPVSFKLKATTAPDPTVPDDDLETSGGMPKIEFKTDLSAYERYMNPANAAEYLILVNKTSKVDESYKPTDLISVADTRQDGRATQQMREAAAKALEALFIEMRAAGFTDVSVMSGYRSYTYQNQLYTDYTNREMTNNPSLTLEQAQAIVDTYSARPGTSEHQTGLCCDMHNLPSADKSFAEDPAYDWLEENAWKFGFILRFPADKTDITGYDFEPWHYRFVGRNAAWQITNGGLCLEEFVK